MAKQGLNIVLVALPDNLLDDTFAKLSDTYRGVQFRKIGVNLGDVNGSYLNVIAEETQDLDIQIIFSNAGYGQVCSFYRQDLHKLHSMAECNMTSHYKIAHLFINRLIAKKLRGALVFTSSQVSFFPTPMSVMYASTKAFLVQMAVCLSTETAAYGIDVTTITSGPMKTRFNDNLPRLSALRFFEAIASSAEEVAETMINSVGRIVVRDASLYTIATRLVSKLIDVNALCTVITYGQPLSSDWKKFKDLR